MRAPRFTLREARLPGRVAGGGDAEEPAEALGPEDVSVSLTLTLTLEVPQLSGSKLEQRGRGLEMRILPPLGRWARRPFPVQRKA